MISDPIATPTLPEEGAAGSFAISDFTGAKTIRLGQNTAATSSGRLDSITISHSNDPKTKRRRSLFRVDYGYYPVVGETTSQTQLVNTAYIVLDYVPGLQTSVSVNAALTRLSTLWNNGPISSVISSNTSVLYKWLQGQP